MPVSMTPCRHCALPVRPQRGGTVCDACCRAQKRGRLPQRLEVLREKAARGMVASKPARVQPEIGPGVRVRLLSEPHAFGRVGRRERDGWMVWFDGAGYMKCFPKELRVMKGKAAR